MNAAEKRIIFSDLIYLREKLIGAAKRRDESISEYGRRIRNYNKLYISLGKIAQQNFQEITELEEDRENLTIYAYLKGLPRDVKRYLSPLNVYKSLAQAQAHAQNIHNRLKDVRNIRHSILIDAL